MLNKVLTIEQKRERRRLYQFKYKRSAKGIAARRAYELRYQREMPESVRQKRLAYAKRRAKTTVGIASDRRSRLKRVYGLSELDFQLMALAQGGKCAICLKISAARLHIDHNHSTGKIRALLCGSCNLGLGYFREDAGAMRNAAKYVEVFNCA